MPPIHVNCATASVVSFSSIGISLDFVSSVKFPATGRTLGFCDCMRMSGVPHSVILLSNVNLIL